MNTPNETVVVAAEETNPRKLDPASEVSDAQLDLERPDRFEME